MNINRLAAPRPRPAGPDDLVDLVAGGLERVGDAGPVGARALDAGRDPRRAGRGDQLGDAGRVGGELPRAEPPAERVQQRERVRALVRVDAGERRRPSAKQPPMRPPLPRGLSMLRRGGRPDETLAGLC